MISLIFSFCLLIGGCASSYVQSATYQNESLYLDDEGLQNLGYEIADAFLSSKFFEDNDRRCYKFGKISNETYEHINTHLLIETISSRLKQNKKVCIREDSFFYGIFYGRISAIYQETKRDKDMFYTFRFYLINGKTTELVWSETKEIRKRGKRKLIGW